MFVSSKQTSVVPILHIESDDKPLLSPLEQMVQNRKTIAELISPNLPEEQVRKNVLILLFKLLLCFLMLITLFSLQFSFDIKTLL